jgi:5-methylcytosine-specific restriction endonuclease McrA
VKYSEQLQQPEWREKRAKILQKDGFRCTACGSKSNLHVHHKKYIKGKMPWEVPNEFLTTLCSPCHTEVHKGKDINSFILKKPKKKAKKPVKKKKNRMEGFSTEQKRIQARYDALKNR